MRVYLAVFLFVLIPSASRAVVWHVDPGGGGDFVTIQEAIDSAADGDEIVVAQGVYVENIDYFGKDVWVHSIDGPAVTSIDGGHVGSCVTFRSGESPDAILEGFAITSGAGTFYEGVMVGGAVFCVDASPTFRDCWFLDNVATYAAGIYVNYGSDPLVEDCIFRGNVAETYGGAIAGPRSRPTIRGCIFEDNFAGTGDGTIHLALDSLIEDCVLRNNEARAGAAVNAGGYGADFVIRNCIFEGNRAHGIHGGAIRVHEASPVIEGCLFVSNSAEVDGGAIIAIDGADPLISNCTFDGNDAGRYGGTIAIWEGSGPMIQNCIIAGTVQGGGVFCSSAWATFICNDVWENGGGNYLGSCGDPTGEDGNIALDPRFCNPEVLDYNLAVDSPCAPENNPECGQIGAFGVGCDGPTPVAQVTWGGMKALYR